MWVAIGGGSGGPVARTERFVELCSSPYPVPVDLGDDFPVDIGRPLEYRQTQRLRGRLEPLQFIVVAIMTIRGVPEVSGPSRRQCYARTKRSFSRSYLGPHTSSARHREMSL